MHMKEAVKTNGKRNRKAGHMLECQLAARFRDAGYPHVVTSRSESKNKDNNGVDIMNMDEFTNGRLPYNVQCKNSTQRLQYEKILKEMPDHKDVVNVIVHKMTERIGARFQPRGTYVILDLDDFMAIVSELRLHREERANQ